MLDLSHIPSQQQQTFTFYAISGSNSWQTWQKPRNAKMIEVFCLGGGAGGGRGNNNSLGGQAGGGAGSGAITRGIVPAFLLPDTLYIQVGKGGTGAILSNTSGNNGGVSYVGLQPSTSEQVLVCKSGGTSTGGSNVNGAAGAGAAQAVVTLSAFGNLGLFTSIGGVIGTTGGLGVTPTAGANAQALGTSLVTGGAGGGGKTSTTFAIGGSIISASVILTTQVNGGIIDGQNGTSGYGLVQPFCGTGGAGGAGSVTVGGNGGNGWYGCGGGGGGGGVTSGNGGNGGDGLVIITVIT
jgi:hypothetical protein